MTHGYYQCDENGAKVGGTQGPFQGPGATQDDALNAGVAEGEFVVFRWAYLDKIEKQLAA